MQILDPKSDPLQMPRAHFMSNSSILLGLVTSKTLVVTPEKKAMKHVLAVHQVVHCMSIRGKARVFSPVFRWQVRVEWNREGGLGGSCHDRSFLLLSSDRHQLFFWSISKETIMGL